VTVLVAGIGVVLSLTFAAFFGQLGIASSERFKAQTAADAAALAAVAESGPYGHGQPERLADMYARMNGGRVTECRCQAGATAVQVEVTVDGISASSRAVIDPSMFAPALFGYGSGHLHPLLANAVDSLISLSGGAISVNSGYRSSDEQASLWAEALKRYGSAEAADDWVAPPGTSMHERGLAVDLGGDIPLALRLIEKHDLPLWRPMDHEPWHFELVGSRS
jgi:D-alanyl-D-alanine carboxypeptidase/Putative Flp pilus-assembly TadE/G-like